MPKVVDYAQRRREIASALWRVVSTRGVHAVSVRNVAEECGTSLGALRHYFRSQEELLAFALESVYEQINARLQAKELVDEAVDPVESAAQIIEELLPLDHERRAEVFFWIGFSTGMWTGSVPEQVSNDGWNGSAHVARVAVARLRRVAPPTAIGAALEDERLEWIARQLQLMVDGWCVQLLFYPQALSPALVQQELRRALAQWSGA